MENIQNQNVPTAEELEQEQIALHLPKEEEVRASVISEFGFDEELDTDKIDKAVAKEMVHKTDIVKVVGQKIKYRDLANKSKEATPPISQVKIDPDEVGKLVDTKLTETLEKRDLDSLDYPDDLKGEISKLAKLQGVSIKKAVKDPYIVFKIETYEKEQKTNEATISRTHKSGSSKEFDVNNPPAFDPNDVVGSDKAMKEWEAEAKKRGL